jgi:hypothetical protein
VRRENLLLSLIPQLNTSSIPPPRLLLIQESSPNPQKLLFILFLNNK